MRLADALVAVGACPEARDWLASRPPVADSREHWDACGRGDWLLWLAARAGVDRRLVVRAACACARISLVHVPAGELRPLRAIEAAEGWARGEVAIEGVRAAYAAAYAAADADAAYAAAHAAAAAYAAYAAAAAADADADVYAADADAAAAAAADADADVQRATLARCADAVRSVIPWADVDRALHATVTR